MSVREQTILVVSDNTSFWAEARKKLEASRGRPRVAAVGTVEAAHRILEATAPAVILMEAEETEARTAPERAPRLEAAVSSLAIYAPVVVIGPAEREEELTSLVAAGVAEYVSRPTNGLREAVERVEVRLQAVRLGSRPSGHIAAIPAKELGPFARQDFGEVLRHELNNPLTGILGNAELLLAELRRKNDGRIPVGGQQRLETIAALAVRLRETVRHLSEQWESRQRAVRQE